jgi:hypothetical protein
MKLSTTTTVPRARRYCQASAVWLSCPSSSDSQSIDSSDVHSAPAFDITPDTWGKSAKAEAGNVLHGKHPCVLVTDRSGIICCSYCPATQAMPMHTAQSSHAPTMVDTLSLACPVSISHPAHQPSNLHTLQSNSNIRNMCVPGSEPERCKPQATQHSFM